MQLGRRRLPIARGGSGGQVRLPIGFEPLTFGFSDLRTLAEEIVRYGADAVVLDPPELGRVLDMLARSRPSEADAEQDLDDSGVGMMTSAPGRRLWP